MTRDPFQVVRLDEIEPSTAREGWVPIRRHLGIASFGINAWSAAEGGEVIPDHDEVPTGHEELYYVLEGTATFTLDGQTAEAPAGTLVLVSEPGDEAERRSPVPAGPPSSRSGGKPGEAFRVSAWEVNSEVFPLFDRGEYAEAKRLLAETLAEHARCRRRPLQPRLRGGAARRAGGGARPPPRGRSRSHPGFAERRPLRRRPRLAAGRPGLPVRAAPAERVTRRRRSASRGGPSRRSVLQEPSQRPRREARLGRREDLVERPPPEPGHRPRP